MVGCLACQGLCFGFGVLLPFFILGGMGAADVKLLAGIGAWVGIHDVIAIFLVFGTLMGLYSIAASAFHGRGTIDVKTADNPLVIVPASRRGVAQDPAVRNRRVVPMAPAMAIAIVLLALLPRL